MWTVTPAQSPCTPHTKNTGFPNKGFPSGESQDGAGPLGKRGQRHAKCCWPLSSGSIPDRWQVSHPGDSASLPSSGCLKPRNMLLPSPESKCGRGCWVAGAPVQTTWPWNQEVSQLCPTGASPCPFCQGGTPPCPLLGHIILIVPDPALPPCKDPALGNRVSSRRSAVAQQQCSPSLRKATTLQKEKVSCNHDYITYTCTEIKQEGNLMSPASEQQMTAKRMHLLRTRLNTKKIRWSTWTYLEKWYFRWTQIVHVKFNSRKMYLLAFLSHLLLEMMDWLLGPLSLLFLTFCLDFF